MSTAVVDIFCHACSRESLGTDYPPAYNSDHERICPQCSSDFIELREAESGRASPQRQPTDPQTSRSARSGPTLPFGTSSQRIVTPDGVHVDLLVTTAVVPTDVYEQVRSQTGGQMGSALVLHLGENGMLMSGPPGNFPGLGNLGNLGNVGDFALGNNLDQLLDRLMQQYQPPVQPVAEDVLDALPRRFVRSQAATQPGESGAPALAAEAVAAAADDDPEQYASCTAGEPCTVCHDDFSQGELVVELPCNHCFHENCILPWLRTHNTCPVCRHKLGEERNSHRRSRGGTYRSSGNSADSPNNRSNANRSANRASGSGRAAAPANDDDLPNLISQSDDDDTDDDMPGLIRISSPTASNAHNTQNGPAPAPNSLGTRLSQLQSLLQLEYSAQERIRQQMSSIRSRAEEVQARHQDATQAMRRESDAMLRENDARHARFLEERDAIRTEAQARLNSITERSRALFNPSSTLSSTGDVVSGISSLDSGSLPDYAQEYRDLISGSAPSSRNLPQRPNSGNVRIPQGVLGMADQLAALVRRETGMTNPQAIEDEVTRRMVEAVNGGSSGITQLVMSVSRDWEARGARRQAAGAAARRGTRQQDREGSRADAGPSSRSAPGGEVGRHMTSIELQEFTEHVRTSADIAESLLRSLQPTRSGSYPASSTPDSSIPDSLPSLHTLSSDSFTSTAGSPLTHPEDSTSITVPLSPTASSAIQSRSQVGALAVLEPRMLPAVLRIVVQVVNWAFNNIRNLFRF